MDPKTIGVIFVGLLVLIFIIFIFIGGGFISNVLFSKSADDLSHVGLDTGDKIRISQMTIIIFWLLFLPLVIYGSLVVYKTLRD